jgi:hypothetical protein
LAGYFVRKLNCAGKSSEEIEGRREKIRKEGTKKTNLTNGKLIFLLNE